MRVWILTVWLSLAGIDQIWLQQPYRTQEECQQWQNFYNEYPFRPVCQEEFVSVES